MLLKYLLQYKLNKSILYISREDTITEYIVDVNDNLFLIAEYSSEGFFKGYSIIRYDDIVYSRWKLFKLHTTNFSI